MFYSLRGKLIHTEINVAVIECGGVGFKCLVSANTMRSLPGVGAEAQLFTHLNVTQDNLTLFGFASETELSCFKMLTSVSGIGSKTAVSVLSAMSPEQLALSIAAGDHKALTCAQGIGPKQAQRIVLELKDKMKGLGAPVEDISAAASSAAALPGNNAAEAIRALMVLGCSSSEAATLVAKLDNTQPVEKIISQALKLMAK